MLSAVLWCYGIEIMFFFVVDTDTGYKDIIQS